MFARKSFLAGIALTTGLLMAAPAFADWDHHGHGGGDWGHHDHDHWEHHDHGRGGISLSFGYGYNPYYDGYYGYPHYYHHPYYYGYPAYYSPPPTVVYESSPQVVYVPSQAVLANQTSPTYTNDEGLTCREYQATGRVNGHIAPTYGTACLQPDGSWRIVQ